MIAKATAGAALALLISLAGGQAWADSAPTRLPAPKLAIQAASSRPQTAVFSGGCFWGVQGVFSHVRGVTRAVSGYSGGGSATAHYAIVSTGTTGHAESVEVTYNPAVVSYGELLRVFFSVALDPTQINRQGPDDGSQYRSVLWVANPEQQMQAKAYMAQLDATHIFDAPIATQVRPLKAFYPAEAYHQDFMARHPDHPYIQAWDAEKVAALRKLYPDLYAAKPASAG
jgi:peptide-methionine (S)-S-oxide reductase